MSFVGVLAAGSSLGQKTFTPEKSSAVRRTSFVFAALPEPAILDSDFSRLLFLASGLGLAETSFGELTNLTFASLVKFLIVVLRFDLRDPDKRTTGEAICPATLPFWSASAECRLPDSEALEGLCKGLAGSALSRLGPEDPSGDARALASAEKPPSSIPPPLLTRRLLKILARAGCLVEGDFCK